MVAYGKRVYWIGVTIGLGFLLLAGLAWSGMVGKTAVLAAESTTEAVLESGRLEIVVTETVTVGDRGGRAGDSLAMAEVNGRPALAFYNETRSSVQFMRAADEAGAAWEAPVDVYLTGYVESIGMGMVNGRPALVFGDFAQERVVYVRASDENGTSWEAPVTIDSPAAGGGWYDLEIVNGRPAVAYALRPVGSGNRNELRYVRANDANGTAWGSPMTIDDSSQLVGIYSRLTVVDGNPAIAYQNRTLFDLMFVRATDANGAAWGTPQPLATFGSMGDAIAMEIVDGRATIVHHNASFNRIELLRAATADGSSWGAAVTVTVASRVYEPMELEIANGRPLLLFQSGEGASIVRADDASGGSWGATRPIFVEPNPDERPSHVQLGLFDGKPSAALYSEDQLAVFYGQAINGEGTAWEPLEPIYGGSVGARNALARLSDGRLGMSFHDNASEALYFAASTDESGLAWGEPVLVDENATVAQREQDLLLANGRPAIVYGNERKTELRYVRATDAVGSAWLSPTVIVTGRIDTVGGGMINGRPVAAFLESQLDELQFIRANDADGTSWDSPVTVAASSFAGENLELFALEGNPAVIHWRQRNLLLSRTATPTGSSWLSPTTIVTNATGIGYAVAFQQERLAVALYVSDVINGRGSSGGNTRLVYVRAADATGASWGEPVTVVENEFALNRPFLLTLNGRPAIVYNRYDFQTQVNNWYLVRAEDATGDVWGEPALLFSLKGEPSASLLALDDLWFGLSFGEDALRYFDYQIALRYELFLPMVRVE